MITNLKSNVNPQILQNPNKQSLNNILKNPNFPQTIIQQHPENP
ncbi:hypothetical protein [Anabaena sp. AL93]|nr:hypothetical protein [Anabaena sp. AL93]